MNLILSNLKKVLFNIKSLITTIFSMGAIAFLFFYFQNSQLVIGNLGFTFYISEIILEILISLLFGLFIGSTVYKMFYFSSTKKKHIGIGGIASFFGILVTGCPACSITVASYLGLASVISVFPYHGLELKILSLFMLLYVVYDTLKTLEVCSIKNK